MGEPQKEQVISEAPDKLKGQVRQSKQEPSGIRFYRVSLIALGVIFGDISISPLYALRECFQAHRGIHPTPDKVLGILSLIFWSLIFIISIKYLMHAMRADNEGAVTCYVGGQALIPIKERKGMAVWREALYAFMARNSTRSVAFYALPPEQVMGISIDVEL